MPTKFPSFATVRVEPVFITNNGVGYMVVMSI